MIRNAAISDVPRLAEILIFAKRMAYRPIFNNDSISFNEMQVCKLASELQKDRALDNIIVYDDGIVKGMMNRKAAQYNNDKNSIQLCEFFVDPFFQQNGIGSEMMKHLVNEAELSHAENIFLWVLEKNNAAIKFYENFGFACDGNKKHEEGTEEYILRYFKTI